MKTHINLLPPSAQSAKNFRKRVKILLLAQVGIFLLIAAGVFRLINAERDVWPEATALSERVAALAPAAEEAARANAIREIFADALPVVFDGEWLDLLLLAIPDEVTLIRIDYNQGDMLITAETADINIIETHRANMAQIFTYVRQGRITRIDEGLYAYEIRVIFE